MATPDKTVVVPCRLATREESMGRGPQTWAQAIDQMCAFAKRVSREYDTPREEVVPVKGKKKKGC